MLLYLFFCDSAKGTIFCMLVKVLGDYHSVVKTQMIAYIFTFSG